MIEKLKRLGLETIWRISFNCNGLLLHSAFIFGGFGGGFSTNNQNNIAKINKTNM